MSNRDPYSDYRRVGLALRGSLSRHLGTERTQAELPRAILITAERAFLEK